ncbi:MAG: hypothetical protein HC828_15510 [Blastochloris sp.]|nr:hypothetical protein [Blastochloris sp.]
MDAYFARLGDLWFPLLDHNLKTTLEQPEPSRSDCHGWGSHPLYHDYASILGIRPAGLGFRMVTIQPQFGPLTHVSGTLMHPQGEIMVDLYRERDTYRGRIALPNGISAIAELGQRSVGLQAGLNHV